jgi:hypothetical protein
MSQTIRAIMIKIRTIPTAAIISSINYP